MRSALSLFLAIAALAAGPVAARGQDHVVEVWTDSLRGVVRGRGVPVDGGTFDGLSAAVRVGNMMATTALDSTGAFELRLPGDFRRGAEVEVWIDVAGTAPRRYFPSYARVSVRDIRHELRLVLVPMYWQITTGTYAGERVPLMIHDAFLPAQDAGLSSFYERTPIRAGTLADPPYRPAAWPAESFPIPVVLLRSGSGARIAARDSVEFWRNVDALETDFGFDMFRPMSEPVSETLDTIAAHGMILVGVDRRLGVPGTGAAFRVAGQILGGRLNVWSRSTLREGRVVMHELLHAIGFGHTCSWQSLMAAGCEMLRSERATPHDVAHAQAFLRIWQVQREHRTLFGVVSALNGERVVLLGIPPESGTVPALLPIAENEELPGQWPEN